MILLILFMIAKICLKCIIFYLSFSCFFKIKVKYKPLHFRFHKYLIEKINLTYSMKNSPKINWNSGFKTKQIVPWKIVFPFPQQICLNFGKHDFSIQLILMFAIHQKDMHLNHNFYVVVGKQCRTENAYKVTNTKSLYKLTNVLLLFICFKLVIKLMEFLIYFHLQKNTFIMLTRTKTSIRYAKENDKKKREGRKERERKVEGEI